VLLVSRALLCPITLYFVVKSQFPLALNLFVIATLTQIIAYRLARPLKEPARWIVPDAFCDRLYCLSLFSTFMAFGACPSWFMGLCMTVALLKFSGLLFLRFVKSGNVALAPIAAGRWNSILQLGWIGLTLLAATFQGGLTSSHPLFRILALFGYAGLAAFQISVFFGYFSKYRVQIVPAFVPLLVARD